MNGSTKEIVYNSIHICMYVLRFYTYRYIFSLENFKINFHLMEHH